MGRQFGLLYNEPFLKREIVASLGPVRSILADLPLRTFAMFLNKTAETPLVCSSASL